MVALWSEYRRSGRKTQSVLCSRRAERVRSNRDDACRSAARLCVSDEHLANRRVRGKFISLGGVTLPSSAPTLFSTCPRIAGLALLTLEPSRGAALPSCRLCLRLRTKSDEYRRHRVCPLNLGSLLIYSDLILGPGGDIFRHRLVALHARGIHSHANQVTEKCCQLLPVGFGQWRLEKGLDICTQVSSIAGPE